MSRLSRFMLALFIFAVGVFVLGGIRGNGWLLGGSAVVLSVAAGIFVAGR